MGDERDTRSHSRETIEKREGTLEKLELDDKVTSGESSETREE